MTKIIFNGISYERLEDMPPEARQAYEHALSLLPDKNQNGTPDVLEGHLSDGKIKLNTRIRISTQRKITYKGQVYSSADELPAEARQAYQQAIGKLEAERDGAPDRLAGALPPANVSMEPITATPPMIPAPPIIPAALSQPDDTDRARQLVVAIAVILLLVLLSGVVAVVLYNSLYAGAR